MKKKLMDMLAKKNERKTAVTSNIEASQDVAEVRSLSAELDTLNTEIRSLQEMIDAIPAEVPAVNERTAAVNANIPAPVAAGAQQEQHRVDPELEKRTKRGQALKEMRSVTVGSSNIVLPAHKASDIKPTFNEVSSLIDRVNVMNLPGGESFTQPYEAGYGEGDYKTEESAYASAEPSFGYASINKAKVTAYAEDTEEVLKLPAADYDAIVMKGIPVALRKKITKEILVGNGTTNHLVGIFDDGATAISAATDIDFAEIDETTLDEIIYSFGGDEDVEDTAVLILNKLDLKAFATLRDADGKKIYDVKNNGNSGTIDGVPFIINSACNAISDSGTSSGEYAMAYGPLSNYTLAIFADIDIQRSTDFKFSTGHIAHRGSTFVGGNVTAKNGFLRVKKS